MINANQIVSILKTRKFWREFALMTVAMFISAAAVYYFLVPSKLIVGSISGLSIVLSEVLSKFGVHFPDFFYGLRDKCLAANHRIYPDRP